MARRNRKIKNNKEAFYKGQFTAIALFIIALLGFIIYSNTFQASFHLDDHAYIKDNPLIKDIGAYFKAQYWLNPYHRPVSTFSFILNYTIDGFNVGGYHLVNIIIHILSAITVFFLSQLVLLKSVYSNSAEKRKRNTISFFIALLFLSHPIQTQSVNYIVQRMTLLAALFYLLTVFAFFKARILHAAGQIKNSIPFYLLSATLFYLALFSKQNAASIPLVLLIIEILFVRNSIGRKNLPLIISMSAIIFLGMLVISIGGYLPQEADHISRESYFATQTRVIFNYIKLLILPNPLNFDPLVALSTSLFGWLEIIALIGHLSILSFGIYIYKKNKLITFGIFWFYITLLIESSIIPIRDVMFEHRLYLPAFGFVFILVISLFNYIKNKKGENTAIFVFSVLVLIYSIMSFQRNKVWLTEFSLWSSVKAQAPAKARCYSYVGVEYVKMGKYKEALKDLDMAIKLDSNRWEEHINKATVYRILNYKKALIQELSICIEMEPNMDRFLRERAEVYIELKELSKAERDITKAILIDSTNKENYFWYGLYFIERELYEEARNQFTKAIELDHKYILAYNNRGICNMRLENYSASIADYDLLLKIDKTHKTGYSNRGDAHFFAGNFNNAISDYSHSIILEMKDGSMYKKRGIAYTKVHKYELALADFKKAKTFGISIGKNIFNELEELIKLGGSENIEEK